MIHTEKHLWCRSCSVILQPKTNKTDIAEIFARSAVLLKKGDTQMFPCEIYFKINFAILNLFLKNACE